MDMIKAMWPSPEDDTRPVPTPGEQMDMLGGNAVDLKSRTVTSPDTEFTVAKREVPDAVLDAAKKEVSKTFSPQDSGYEEALKDEIRRRIAGSSN
jgi:hypothetical protein